MKYVYTLATTGLLTSLILPFANAGMVWDHKAIEAHRAVIAQYQAQMARFIPLEKNYKDTQAKIAEIESLLEVRSDQSSIKLVAELLKRPEISGKLGLNSCTAILLLKQWQDMVQAFHGGASQTTRDNVLSALEGIGTQIDSKSELPAVVVEGIKRAYGASAVTDSFPNNTEEEISHFFEVLDASVLFPLKPEAMTPIQFVSKIRYLTELTGGFDLDLKKRGVESYSANTIFSELARSAMEALQKQTVQTISAAIEKMLTGVAPSVPAYLQQIAITFQKNKNTRHLAFRALESFRRDNAEAEKLYLSLQKSMAILTEREVVLKKAANTQRQVGEGGSGRNR